MLKRLDFNGNAYVGIYCRANDAIAFIQPNLPDAAVATVASALHVEPVAVTIGGSPLIGSLMALNSHGMILTDFVEDHERAHIREHFDGEILIIDDRFNAAGNNILASDHGAVVHPLMQRQTVRRIEETLDIEAVQGSVATLNTVGMAAVATGRGALCHPKLEEDERTTIEEVLKVDVREGTVNHGMPYVGAGLVANSHGAITGSTSTGIELNRIEDALDLIGD
jgi:translation initiation factor 6